MTFPLGFWDISLLTAITAIILLITSAMLSPHYGKMSILVNRKKLKNAAIVVSTVFLTTVAMRIIGTVLIS